MGQYVINKDVRIHYSVEGKGKIPLVMISGFGGDMNLWKYNVSGLSRLFKIIRIDNRGSGESDKPEYPYRMEMFSSDVKCVLDDLGIKEAYILGASMGGLITQQVYKDYPEVVKGLFLICTIAGIPVQLQRLVNKVIKNTFYNLTSSLVVPRIVGAFNAFVERKKMSIGSFAENFELPEVDMKIINLLLGKGIEKSSKEEVLNMIYESVVYKVTDEVKEFFIERLNKPATPPNRMSQLEAVLKCSHHELLPKIKVPTLIIHGRNDKILNINEAYYLNKNITNSDLIIYGNCGHFLFLESHVRFNEDIMKQIKIWES